MLCSLNETPLFVAIENDNNEFAKLLIENGADINVKNNYNITPLHLAIRNNNNELIKLLIEKGADINIKILDYSPFYYACLNNNFEMTKLFIENSADINVKRDGFFLLHFACSYNNFEMTKLLIENGANVNVNVGKDSHNFPLCTPLHFACLNNNFEITKLLFENGADLNATIPLFDSYLPGYTSLHITALQNNLKITKFLYDNNADISKLTKDGYTAKTIAKNNNSQNVYNFYLNCDMSNIFVLYSTQNYDEMFKLLNKKPELIIKQNSLGQTILHISVVDNNYEIFKKLLLYKKAIDVQNNRGETVLFNALLDDKIHFAELLIKQGADINIGDNEGYTALNIAIFQGYTEIEKLLIENGATITESKPKLILPFFHSSRINSIAFSPNGKYIISGSMDKTIKLWDLVSGKEIKTFTGHTDWIKSIAFSPDGTKIISGSCDETIKLWDVISGKEIKTFSGHTSQVYSVAFSPDGTKIISGSSDETIKLWDVITGKEIKNFNDNKTVYSVAFSPDGTKIISGSADNTIKMWDVITGKKIKTFIGHTSTVNSVDFSPNGKEIISGSNDETIKLWDIANCKEIRTFSDNNEKFNSVVFSPDATKIISSTSSCNLILWEVATGKKIKTFFGCNINSAAFSSDSKEIIFGTDEEIKIINISTGELIKVFKGNTNRFTSIALSSDGSKIFTSFGDNYLNYSGIWDLANGTEVKYFSEEENRVQEIAFSPDGTKIITGDINNSVILRNASNGEKIKTFEGHTEPIFSIAFSPDGTKIISGSGDNTIRLWDIATGKEIQVFTGHTLGVKSVAFSPVDNKIISGSFDNTIKLWNIETGTEILSYTVEPRGPILTVAFSPDGTKIIIGSGNYFIEGSNIITLYDIFSGEVSVFRGHSGLVNTVNFSQEGTKIISGSNDNIIKLWDVITCKEIKTFINHTSSVFFVTFSPDGSRLISGSYDNTIRIWDIATGNEIVTLISIGNNKWMFRTIDQYYFASKGALKHVSFTVDMQSYNFDQFDLQYNRPDIVLERIGMADSTTIKLYNLAYKKRLKKTGFTEDMFSSEFHTPEIEIIDKQHFANSTDSIFKFDIAAWDSKYKLDRINLWVNNVPIWGMNGKSLRKDSISKYDKKISVLLSQGENKIEVSVHNQKAVESLKQTTYVTYTTKTPTKPNLYVIAIGVSEYEKSQFNLDYAAKDANDLSAALSVDNKMFGKVEIIKFIDKDATTENIKTAKQILMQTTVEDEVIIFFAGHGLLDDNLDYYLATHNINFENPSENGLPYEELENLLDGIPARKKLLLIDACHSGEVDKDELEKTETEMVATSRGVKFRAVTPFGFKPKKKVGLKNSFELMKELFSDLRRGTGATVISASGGGEFAYEGEGTQNGVFTYSVIQALQTNIADTNNDGTIQVSELRDYVFKNVSELTNGKQNPTSRRENLEFDFGIW